jgi:hypothetical protein
MSAEATIPYTAEIVTCRRLRRHHPARVIMQRS